MRYVMHRMNLYVVLCFVALRFGAVLITTMAEPGSHILASMAGWGMYEQDITGDVRSFKHWYGEGKINTFHVVSRDQSEKPPHPGCSSAPCSTAAASSHKAITLVTLSAEVGSSSRRQTRTTLNN